jgi:uracil-DNA glycosylase
MESFSELMGRVRTCDTCASALGHPPRPVLRVGPCARIALIGQAPGAKVHESGVPWQDRSGEHLLEWLGVSRAVFEDPDAFAILPMGFC